MAGTTTYPRSRVLAVGIGAALLTAVFMLAGFPYDRLAQRLTTAFERESGYSVQLEDVGPTLTWVGPGLSAGPIHAASQQGARIRFESGTLRPAWSLGWLRGEPSLHISLGGPDLEVRGILRLGDAPAFVGTLREVDLARLPFDLAPGTEIAGRAQADVEIAFGQGAPVGPVHLVVREGRLTHPMLPVQVPYEELSGDLRFGGEQWLAIQGLDVRSPLITGQASGTIGEPPHWALDLELEFVPNESVRTALAIQGVPIGQDGRVNVHVGGTASNPTLQ